MTLLNCDQDTQRCWKASMLRLLSLKIFWARKRKCSGSSPLLVPTSAMNLRFRVSHIFSQGTLSATTKGTRSWVKIGERGHFWLALPPAAFILPNSPSWPTNSDSSAAVCGAPAMPAVRTSMERRQKPKSRPTRKT